VEYTVSLLESIGVEAVSLYGSMDPAARKVAIGKFRAKKCNFLIVTDLAARGVRSSLP
jgi:ATP-dependent RNA helicase DDX54/DBP10